jgi:hypothetical protein
VASPAWQRAEGKNPEGGLNARGRASYKAETGGTLRAPVSGRPAGPEEMRSKGSFLSRMGNMAGPERKPNGEPTRLLLSLKAWGADSKAEAKSMGKRLLEQYANQKATKK